MTTTTYISEAQRVLSQALASKGYRHICVHYEQPRAAREINSGWYFSATDGRGEYHARWLGHDENAALDAVLALEDATHGRL